MTQYDTREPDVSGWAVAGITFAATILLLVGIFEIIAGLAAIFDDDFYVITQNYAFDLVLTAWGLYAGQAWAAVTAIVVAVLSAVANFFFIPYYPFWSILMIALAVWVIWALTRPGALTRG
jgi:hypothetical protein